jgi:hypothetical protein
MNLIFRQLGNKTLKKLSAHVQIVPISYYKPAKKYSSRDTIPLALYLYASLGHFGHTPVPSMKYVHILCLLHLFRRH